MQAKRALIGSHLTPFSFSVFDFYLHYIRSHRSKTLLYYNSFDSFVTYLHLLCYPVSTYLVTALLLTLLLCLHVSCYCVITYFVTLSSIIMSFAFCQQYYCSNHNYELWIVNSELILVFGGHEKSLENLLLSTSKLWSCGCRTRTCDLQVMSLASYQLLQPAMLIKNNSSMNRGAFLNCECKGSGLLRNYQEIIHYLTNYPLCFCGF